MTTPFAANVLPSSQSGVLSTLRIDLQVFSLHCVIRAVNTIVNFISFECFLGSAAKFTFKNKIVAVTDCNLSGFEHVVTLFAEAHSLELGSSLLGLGIIVYILRR